MILLSIQEYSLRRLRPMPLQYPSLFRYHTLWIGLKKLTVLSRKRVRSTAPKALSIL
jgi:hypothetical protein